MKLRCERGSATVEFALITPVLLLFLLGIFEFGRAWNTQQITTDAARGAARLVSVSEVITEDSVRRAVYTTLRGASLDTTKATVTVTGLNGATGTPATVTVQYNYTFMIWPRSAQQGRTALQLRSAAVMRRE